MRKTTETERHIINALRKATITWPGRAEALRRARKKVHGEGETKSGKFHWQCAKCLEWFRDSKSVEVDHIVEVGPFCGDWNQFIGKLFCGQDNLQVLCLKCHAKKTSGFNAALLYKRKG